MGPGSYFFRSVSSSAGSGGTMQSFATFTPTGSWTLNCTYTGGYSRLGEYMFLNVKIALAGAPNGTASMTINLPTGFSMDLGKIGQASSGNRSAVLGSALLDSNAGAFPLLVTENDATSIFLASTAVTSGGGSFIARNSLSSTLPTGLTNGNNLTAWAAFPILGWAP